MAHIELHAAIHGNAEIITVDGGAGAEVFGEERDASADAQSEFVRTQVFDDEKEAKP